MAYTTILEQYVHNLHTNKTCVIFGCAAEGVSTYQFLRQCLPETPIILTDDKPQDQLPQEFQKFLTTDVQLSYSTPEQLSNAPKNNYIVYKTPGISPAHPLLKYLQHQTGIVQTSNTNLFLTLLTQIPEEHRPHTVGVTGTKGKSTTTAVTAHILKVGGRQVLLAGNIGVPALDLMEKIYFYAQHELSDAYVVLELSSHQILDLTVSPQTVIMQDITPEHLDYYASFQHYWQAKARLVSFQTSQDQYFYNPDYAIPRLIADQTPATKTTFSLTPHPQQLVWCTADSLVLADGTEIVRKKDLPLVGDHNIINILPGITYALQQHISVAEISSALKNFQPLPHRLNYVATVNDVRYYNDSQATTPEAACAALKSFSDTGVVLIAGGSDKGVTFEALAEQILGQTIRAVVLLPPMGAVIGATITEVAAQTKRTIPLLLSVNSMKEAVSQAVQQAQPGDVVLLSPACASFGLFKNYKDRGDQFVAAVESIVASKP